MMLGFVGGRALLQLRERAGLSIEEVAAMVGTDPEYLDAVERGTEIAEPSYAARIARAIAPQLRQAARPEHPSP